MSLFSFLFGSSNDSSQAQPTNINPCSGLSESSPGSGVDAAGNVMYSGCNDSAQVDMFDSSSSIIDDSSSSMSSFSDDSFSSSFDDTF